MTLRLGLIGASRIAPKAAIDPVRATDGVEITCVAARDPERARAYAQEWDLPDVAADYEALCRRDDVDAVFISLPASLHHPWTMAALAAGKHVLCEKPIADNEAQAAEMVAAARDAGLVLVEAFHWRYHPSVERLRELVDQIGPLRRMEADFSVTIPRDDIRFVPELGGGALMDLGCYCVQWVRFVAGSEPTVRAATAIEDPPGVDLTMTADLHFDGDVEAVVRCSMSADEPARASLAVEGDGGRVVFTNPVSPHRGGRLRIEPAPGGPADEETCDDTPTYTYQMRAFVAAVTEGLEVPTGGEDAIATMATIDAIYRAAGMAPRGT
ncbi:MAG: Gfo/Idh/MocA family oxidoreductase [Actinomycetota bacterium]|nr:Gfo/Idh/MocA family oxidoreductase [Actinomycetota bacterium]